MSVVAIIAEYNPFHNGHAYQIEMARKLTGAEHVVVLMSGDFVQRGEPAVMDKYVRTKMALYGGADFVFELPVRIATASAEDYGYGAVKLLKDLGNIDFLCFGAEDDDLSNLNYAADFFLHESDDYRHCLKEFLKSGLSYPRARQKAYAVITGRDSEFLAKPNNILAISYLKALKSLDSRIIPVCVKRIGNYHSTELEETFSSATAIRKELTGKDADPERIKNYVPGSVYPLYEEGSGTCCPITAEGIWPMLSYKLLLEEDKLSEYYDIPAELYNRIRKVRSYASGFEDLCDRLVSPAYTKSRIRRGLIHVFLNLKKSEVSSSAIAEGSPYLRLLGFRRSHAVLLKEFEKTSSMTILHKSYPDELTDQPDALNSYEKDIFASELYTLLQRNRYTNIKYIHEYSRKLIKI